MGVWLRKSSHRFHGFAQMAWLRLFSHGIHGIHRSFVALVLPQISQNSQKFGCVSPSTEFTEFTEVRLRKFSHGIHRIHRSLGVLLAAWVRQDAIPSYICAHLWEPLLSQKVLCVPWVLWEYSLPRISQINTDGLVASVLPRISQNSQKFGGAVGCVGTAECHTLLHLCASVGATSQPEGSVLSVRSVGI